MLKVWRREVLPYFPYKQTTIVITDHRVTAQTCYHHHFNPHSEEKDYTLRTLVILPPLSVALELNSGPPRVPVPSTPTLQSPPQERTVHPGQKVHGDVRLQDHHSHPLLPMEEEMISSKRVLAFWSLKPRPCLRHSQDDTNPYVPLRVRTVY